MVCFNSIKQAKIGDAEERIEGGKNSYFVFTRQVFSFYIFFSSSSTRYLREAFHCKFFIPINRLIDMKQIHSYYSSLLRLLELDNRQTQLIITSRLDCIKMCELILRGFMKTNDCRGKRFPSLIYLILYRLCNLL